MHREILGTSKAHNISPETHGQLRQCVAPIIEEHVDLLLRYLEHVLLVRLSEVVLDEASTSAFCRFCAMHHHIVDHVADSNALDFLRDIVKLVQLHLLDLLSR